MARSKALLKILKQKGSPLSSLDDEKRAEEALAAILESGLRRNGYPVYSLRHAARDFKVTYQKLTRRYNGIPEKKKSHADQQTLSPPQEEILVKWVKAVGERGVPWTRDVLLEKASLIAGKPLSLSWPYLTSEENILATSEADFRTQLVKADEERVQNLKDAEKAARKAVEDAQKAAEREEKARKAAELKAQKDLERAEQQRRSAAEKLAKAAAAKAEKQALAAAAKAEKEAQAAAAKAEKVARAAAAKAEKQALAATAKLAKQDVNARGSKQKQKEVADEGNNTPESTSHDGPPKKRPRPRPAFRDITSQQNLTSTSQTPPTPPEKDIPIDPELLGM
ncbi:hypothetical protein BD410DRAFT_839650 [Rickenella mellea]|uniref:HTH CENPB-type domain-containing protein n=1 Tax=Rickenella mellea TaxID=50990 RepID=A0A4Y7Q5U7_9AGAM|nr:hypothetical protein BD410DRAFT_839650 [Rickenella mellea]